jgi:hypothetical protein
LYGGKLVYALGDKITLTVPAGNHSITFDATLFSYNPDNDRYDEYRSRKIVLQYDFEPGKHYQFKGRVAISRGFLTTRAELFMQFYDISSQETLLREWKVVQSLF